MGRFATFLVGGLVGAGIALLTTPRTGEENRALINDTLNENYPDAMKAARATTNQLVDAAATTSTKVINTVVDKGAEVKKGLTSRVEQTAPAVVEKNDELRDKIDAARERIAAQVAKNAEAVHDTAVDAVPVAMDAAKNAKTAVKEAAENATDAAKDIAQSAADAAKRPQRPRQAQQKMWQKPPRKRLSLQQMQQRRPPRNNGIHAINANDPLTIRRS